MFHDAHMGADKHFNPKESNTPTKTESRTYAKGDGHAQNGIACLDVGQHTGLELGQGRGTVIVHVDTFQKTGFTAARCKQGEALRERGSRKKETEGTEGGVGKRVRRQGPMRHPWRRAGHGCGRNPQ